MVSKTAKELLAPIGQAGASDVRAKIIGIRPEDTLLEVARKTVKFMEDMFGDGRETREARRMYQESLAIVAKAVH